MKFRAISVSLSSSLSSRYDHLWPALLQWLSITHQIPNYSFTLFSLLQPEWYLLKCKCDLFNSLLKHFQWYWNAFKIKSKFPSMGIENPLQASPYLAMQLYIFPLSALSFCILRWLPMLVNVEWGISCCLRTSTKASKLRVVGGKYSIIS